MQQAIAYKNQHPEESIHTVADRFHLPYSTFRDHLKGNHDVRGIRTLRNLSVAQEQVLVDKINAYADRGTLLSPRHVKELAQTLSGHTVGVNWTSTFLRRHKQDISSRYYRVQEIARIKADTPENRQAFYKLASTLSQLLQT